MQYDLSSDICHLSDAVKDLMEHIWQEALGEAEDMLTALIQSITIEQVLLQLFFLFLRIYLI